MGNTPDPIKERLEELDRLIEQQKQRLASMPVAGGGISGDDLRAILQSQTETQKALVEQSRTVRHSNPDHLHISAFSHPEGDLARPKPTFLLGKNGKPREVFFNNHRENPEDLTPAEIDAYNLITATCEAREGKWTATVKSNAVYVNVPSFTFDDRSDLPNGLVLILTELAQGPKAVSLPDLIAELTALKQQLQDGRIVSVPA